MIKQRTNQDRYIDMALLIVIFMCGLIMGNVIHDWIYHPDIKHYQVRGYNNGITKSND